MFTLRILFDVSLSINIKMDAIYNSTTNTWEISLLQDSIVEEDSIDFSKETGEESQKKKKPSGGITCCVPGCQNNSLKHRHLSFYVIPKEEELRKRWLHKISRMRESNKKFVPTSTHRVCSEHFVGGKKTYMNNVPTIVPKTIKPTENKPRNTMNSSGAKRCILSPIRPDVTSNIETQLTLEEELNQQLSKLTKEIEDLKLSYEMEVTKLKTEISTLNDANQSMSFSVDRFKHNEAHFKFYTGLGSYKVFKILLNYLEPAASSLIYHGSSTNMEKTMKENPSKCGRARKLNTEEEFFLTLVRLRCGFPLEDMAIRYNLSTSHISRTLITWIDFLHSQFRMLPIWANKKTVADTMPKCFKKEYPTTRVILDCTEIFIEMPTSFRSQSATFSNYKHHNTAKGLVGIAPNGAVTFVSDLYAGRFSDKKITKDSGIYDLLQPGD